MGTLDGKVALITGAGQGVGRGIALALAREGAIIAAAGRTLEKVENTINEVEELGSSGKAYLCDVVSAGDIENTVAAVVKDLGGIHILVNNAQIVPLGNLLDVTEESYQQGMDSGPLATLRFMKACYPHLKGDGAVINLGTSAAVRWDPNGFGAYTAAKEAIRSLSRAAACEWGPDNIRVNCMLPLALSPAMEWWVEQGGDEARAFLNTVPLGRVGDCTEDIGSVAVFLAGPQAKYVTGHSIPVDGGQALMR